jgi:hypothetical protein
MTNRELIKKIRGQFWKLTQRKTNWGRNEALALLEEACTNALASALDELALEARQPVLPGGDAEKRLDQIIQEAQRKKDREKPPTNAVGEWVPYPNHQEGYILP